MSLLDMIGALGIFVYHALYSFISTGVLFSQTQFELWFQLWTWFWHIRTIVRTDDDFPLTIGTQFSIRNARLLIPELSSLQTADGCIPIDSKATIGLPVWMEPEGSVHRVYLLELGYFYLIMVPWGSIPNIRPPIFTSITTIKRIRHHIRPLTLSIRGSSNNIFQLVAMPPRSYIQTFHPEKPFGDKSLYIGHYDQKTVHFPESLYRMSTDDTVLEDMEALEFTLFGEDGTSRIRKSDLVRTDTISSMECASSPSGEV